MMLLGFSNNNTLSNEQLSLSLSLSLCFEEERQRQNDKEEINTTIFSANRATHT